MRARTRWPRIGLHLVLAGAITTRAEAQAQTAPPGPAPQIAPAARGARSAAATDGALTAADLDRLEQVLRGPDPHKRLQAARAIATAGPDGYPVYVERLGRPVLGATETLQGLIHGIWAQYPNPDYPKGPGKDPPMYLTRPEPRWTPPPRVPGQPRARRPPHHDPETVDWLEALAALDLAADELTAALQRDEAVVVRAEMTLRVGLLRAIAGAGQHGYRDAVHPLFDFAFARDGLFRDECGRVIRSLGSYAVPGLIQIYNNRQKTNSKMRRYASYQLDRMDRLRPSQAIGTAPDDATRADIIHAYGESLALDAVEAVLGQVDASSRRVRREARWAWLRYVDGPPPPPVPKRKRKLPGGAEEAEEKEDYLDYREMAALALQRRWQEVFGKPAPERLTPRQLTDQLFGRYDRLQEDEFSQLFTRAQQLERAGDLSGAVDDFGWILANQPDHPRRQEMAQAYRALGEQLARAGERGGDRAQIGRGLGLLRQALALNPAMQQARHVASLIHLLDGLQAQALGGDGLADFRLAVAADASNWKARAELGKAQLQLPGGGFRGLAGRGVIAGAGVSLLLAALWLWRRFRRGAPAQV